MRYTALLLLSLTALRAETGYDAWLRYAPLDETTRLAYSTAVPPVVAIVGDSPLLDSAQAETIRGFRGMLNRVLRAQRGLPNESAIVLGTFSQLRAVAPQWQLPASNSTDGYLIRTIGTQERRYTVVTGSNERGVLYGAFALLRKAALKQPLDRIDEQQTPAVSVRWLNHWDNLDGTIERGYGGRSIFWDALHARADLSRVTDYARMLASLGINGTSINNVNANPRAIASDFLPEVARIADLFRPWGVRIALSIDFGSPRNIGGLDTFDPLDPKVIAWWKDKIDEIYRHVPDLGGIVIKADSEGRVGPSAYNRTHADATNVVARALAPHGGLLFYRGFVYDHHMDWNNPKNDRARAADDNFRPLEGKFDANAFVQIKHGPIDFQVREPASPLFGTLRQTKTAIELQITQEYFGQAKHTVFLAPMWKEVLDFDLKARGNAPSRVRDVVSAFVGVSNVGLDTNWLGNHLSQANLYAFGRLAWDPSLESAQISDEWTRLTFTDHPATLSAINRIQLTSWRTFENYTGPLGLQTLTDIVGNHYGVAVEASERNGWGQWHKADPQGVGFDRSVATGTGYAGQYSPAVAAMYESLALTPDELVTFFHHVPYTHKLRSGKTVIQHLYDSHYEGAAAVEEYAATWASLARTAPGSIDDQRFNEVLAQLRYQAGQAEVWREAVNNWFHRESKIDDAQKRVGVHPGRIEAESMKLTGYTPAEVIPWEGGSGQAVSCPAVSCAASFAYNGQAGTRTLRVRYFDQNNGNARLRLFVNAQLIEEWPLKEWVPSRRIDSSTSALRVIEGLTLRPGDEIRIEGIPNEGETAALDYVELQ